MGAQGGGAARRSSAPRRRPTGGGQIGHPDGDLSGFWVRERPRGTRGSLGPRAERGDALGGGCRAGGVSTRRGSPAVGNPALGKALDRES